MRCRHRVQGNFKLILILQFSLTQKLLITFSKLLTETSCLIFFRVITLIIEVICKRVVILSFESLAFSLGLSFDLFSSPLPYFKHPFKFFNNHQIFLFFNCEIRYWVLQLNNFNFVLGFQVQNLFVYGFFLLAQHFQLSVDKIIFYQQWLFSNILKFRCHFGLDLVDLLKLILQKAMILSGLIQLNL